MYRIKEKNNGGASRSNRALGGICIICAAECPVIRECTKETAETRFGASRAPCRRCSE